jgi:hypothetical protein
MRHLEGCLAMRATSKRWVAIAIYYNYELDLTRHDLFASTLEVDFRRGRDRWIVAERHEYPQEGSYSADAKPLYDALRSKVFHLLDAELTRAWRLATQSSVSVSEPPTSWLAHGVRVLGTRVAAELQCRTGSHQVIDESNGHKLYSATYCVAVQSTVDPRWAGVTDCSIRRELQGAQFIGLLPGDGCSYISWHYRSGRWRPVAGSWEADPSPPFVSAGLYFAGNLLFYRSVSAYWPPAVVPIGGPQLPAESAAG